MIFGNADLGSILERESAQSVGRKFVCGPAREIVIQIDVKQGTYRQSQRFSQENARLDYLLQRIDASHQRAGISGIDC